MASHARTAGAPRGADLRAALGLVVVLVLAVWAYRPLLSLGHLGWDTYPLILTSRIAGSGDLLGAFREELMDGRYPHGHFYRPLTTLSFALEHALWGLEPFGYHLSDLGVLLLGTLGVAALGRRLLGAGPGPVVAALVFALHPLQVESLPIAARRAEPLALLFTLAALVAAPRRRPARGRAALCAACAALALGAKESGASVLLALLALHFAESGAPDLRGRARAALLGTALPALAVALLLLARVAVLGDLGGHPGTSLLGGGGRGLALAPLYAQLLLMPQPLWPNAALVRSCALASALAGVAILAWLARGPQGAGARRTALVSGAWSLVALWLVGASGEVASWYALALLPAFSLLLGALAQGAAGLARGGRRAAAAGCAALLLALCVQALRFSALLHDYAEWPLLSGRSQVFLERVRDAATAAAPGDVRIVRGMPIGLATPLERVGVRSALGLADYSVEAWAELALPGRPLRVRLSDGARPSASEAGVIRIDAVPDAAASESPQP